MKKRNFGKKRKPWGRAPLIRCKLFWKLKKNATSMPSPRFVNAQPVAPDVEGAAFLANLHPSMAEIRGEGPCEEMEQDQKKTKGHDRKKKKM